MSKNYGWTGSIRHGLWRCKKCKHWNYYRTATLRIDSHCRAQGCDYRARVVLDRTPRSGGRPRQVQINEYPSYRPPSSIKIEQRERNTYTRRHREQAERMKLKMDRGVFHTATEIQEAMDAVDLDRHGGTFRMEARPGLKRHPDLGYSRWKFIRRLKVKGAKTNENDPQDPPSKHQSP